MNKYLPISFFIKLDKPLSEYGPELINKLFQIDCGAIEDILSAEDIISIENGLVLFPNGLWKEVILNNNHKIIPLKEFMESEYCLTSLGMTNYCQVYYHEEKEIVVAGCQTVTLAEMRQIKNQLNNNTVDSLQLENGSMVLLKNVAMHEDFFIIKAGNEMWRVTHEEFRKIYEKLKEV